MAQTIRLRIFKRRPHKLAVPSRCLHIEVAYSCSQTVNNRALTVFVLKTTEECYSTLHRNQY